MRSLIVCLSALLSSCFFNSKKTVTANTSNNTIQNVEHKDSSNAIATFGGGCFWCTEAIFAEVKGVASVISGYSGGHVQNPTYKQVCTGETGSVEAIQIKYDSNIVSYSVLLEIFWKTHDPTTPNQQGHDKGPQYQSTIYYHDAKQQQEAEFYKRKLEEERIYDKPIVTDIKPFEVFYSAEDYHQDYYSQNKDQNPYCSAVITPKLEKFRAIFKDRLK